MLPSMGNYHVCYSCRYPFSTPEKGCNADDNPRNGAAEREAKCYMGNIGMSVGTYIIINITLWV